MMAHALNEDGVASLSLAAEKDIKAATDLRSLEDARVRHLGRKSNLTAQFKLLRNLSGKEKPILAAHLNKAREHLSECANAHKQHLELILMESGLENIDSSLPARVRYSGSLHPLTLAMRRICRLLTTAGFEVISGPEVEDEYHNFDALNIPANHPARAMHDTMYLQTPSDDERLLLRSHTSPVQIRALTTRKPPLKIICPGRVYRCDMDVTHTPMFHQVEGLWIDKQINFAHLRGIVSEFLKLFFDDKTLSVRFRASYFPFTEPSAEVDISCVRCSGHGCRICSHSGWLEVMGCGMVHPEVLTHMQLETDKYNGIAFGLGVERLAMLYYGIDDLRLFFENQHRFLRQFTGRVS